MVCKSADPYHILSNLSIHQCFNFNPELHCLKTFCGVHCSCGIFIRCLFLPSPGDGVHFYISIALQVCSPKGMVF